MRPPIFDASCADDVVHVAEPETVRMCRRLVRHGFLFGGSTGTVVTGARDWLARNTGQDALTAVSIAPDLGGNYLDTVYDEERAARAYGPDVSAHARGAAPGARCRVP